MIRDHRVPNALRRIFKSALILGETAVAIHYDAPWAETNARA